jgi:hypothetical protein
MILNRPDIIITVTDVKVSLYQRGHTVPVAELAYTVEHIGSVLFENLIRLGARSAIVLMETSDVLLQSEQLPRTNWLDQRKLVQRRVDLLFPQHELRMAMPLPHQADEGKADYLFVAVPGAPQLTAIYNALAKAQTWLLGVCVFAAEYWAHTRADAPPHRVTLLNMGTHVHLLAEEKNALALSRLLPPAVTTNATLCEQELQTTQSYLLRRGWRMDDRYTLRTHGVPAATDFARTHALPHDVMDHHTPPWQGLVQYLLNGGRPHCRLTPTRLHQRQQLLRVNDAIDKGLHAVLAVVLLMLLVNGVLQTYLTYRNTQLQTALNALPATSATYTAAQSTAMYWGQNSTDIMAYVQPLAATLPPAAQLTNMEWTAEMMRPVLDITINGIPQTQQAGFMVQLTTATQAWVHQQTDGAMQNGALGAPTATDTPLRLRIGQKVMP